LKWCVAALFTCKQEREVLVFLAYRDPSWSRDWRSCWQLNGYSNILPSASTILLTYLAYRYETLLFQHSSQSLNLILKPGLQDTKQEKNVICIDQSSISPAAMSIYIHSHPYALSNPPTSAESIPIPHKLSPIHPPTKNMQEPHCKRQPSPQGLRKQTNNIQSHAGLQ
jgi:hypothetical protein